MLASIVVGLLTWLLFHSPLLAVAAVKFKDRRYEMIAPRVQRHGDVAILTFNLVNYGRLPDRAESALTRWNSTEVYGRAGGKWKIIHSHWSFTKPEVKQPGP